MRRIIVTALAVLTVAAVSATPASAARVLKDFDIYNPSGQGGDWRGRMIIDSTAVRFTGNVHPSLTKATAYGCISASVSGCSLVGAAKTLGVVDGRTESHLLEIDKTFSKTSGQSAWVRACFLHRNGVTNCTNWTAGYTPTSR
ncbi:hypothetical protein GCM10010522_55670 [Kribbella solani]